QNPKPSFRLSFRVQHSVTAEPVAAVNDDDGPADEARGVGAEEECALLYVAYASEATERDVASQSLFDLWRPESLPSFAVRDGAGRDCVDAYGERCPPDREVAR